MFSWVLIYSICLSLCLQWSEESVTTTTWTSQLSTPASACGTASSSYWEASSMSACSWSSSKGVPHIHTLLNLTHFVFLFITIQFPESVAVLLSLCLTDICFKLVVHDCVCSKVTGTQQKSVSYNKQFLKTAESSLCDNPRVSDLLNSFEILFKSPFNRHQQIQY